MRRIVQFKIINLSIISALCFLVAPRVNVAKSSFQRKVDSNQSFTCNEERNKNEQKENLYELSPYLKVDADVEFNFLSVVHDFVFAVKIYQDKLSYFESGLSPPRV